jgi:choline kinase
VNAIVLAAGNGDRFADPQHRSKLLHPFLGQPLLLRTLTSARAAGITRAVMVLGYQADAVRALVEQHAPEGLQMTFAYNPDWHDENGVSVLAARPAVGADRFALLMGDHVFQPPTLAHLLAFPMQEGESVLAVDTRQADARIIAEATKVRRDGSHVVEIGKQVENFDALDTGMFVCSANLFEALETARAQGDATLSGGVRELARQRRMHAANIGEAVWCDIDTPADLEAAESVMGSLAE